MRYFYAKIGTGNTLASEYLSGRTPINKPAIPIFFNCVPGTRSEFLKNGGAKEQGRNFFECADNPENSIIVVINQGKLYLTAPVGDVEFWKAPEDLSYLKKGEFVKLLPIKIISEIPLSDVPAILASITANAYYYTGTFREIKDLGNICALKSLLNKPVDDFDYDKPEQLLLCLSSIELETLIAKIFEEGGCFVPAYRGGAIKDIDIFAKNLTNKDIKIGKFEIPSRSSISIQVKRTPHKRKKPAGCDYIITLHGDRAKEIIDLVKNTNGTKKWLKTSLEWLPAKILRGYGL